MSIQRESAGALESAVTLWLEGSQLPTQFGRSKPRSPCSDRFAPSMIVTGTPVRAWKMAPSFQPPSTPLVMPDQSEPHFFPLPNGSS